MSSHKRNFTPYRKHSRKANLPLPAVKDPTPRAIKGRGGIQAKDYTKFIQWTPKAIAIAAVIIGGPYFGAIALLWIRFGFGAALGLIVLGTMLLGFIGLMYWFASSSF